MEGADSETARYQARRTGRLLCQTIFAWHRGYAQALPGRVSGHRSRCGADWIMYGYAARVLSDPVHRSLYTVHHFRIGRIPGAPTWLQKLAGEKIVHKEDRRPSRVPPAGLAPEHR